MKRFIVLICLLFACHLLFAELLYEKGSDNDYVKLSYSYTDTTETFFIWAHEKRELFGTNYNHYEITTNNEQKAYNLLLLLSECDTYQNCLDKYAEENTDLILQKKEIKLDDYDCIIVYYYYELK
jgi:hypothetical protein